MLSSRSMKDSRSKMKSNRKDICKNILIKKAHEYQFALIEITLNFIENYLLQGELWFSCPKQKGT